MDEKKDKETNIADMREEIFHGSEEETKKVTQAEFDQWCSEGAEFWLVYSPGSVHEESANIGNTHSTEGTNKYLQNLREVLRFTGNICIIVYPSLRSQSVTTWPGSEEMELTED